MAEERERERAISTWARWAMLVHDNPGATYVSELYTGDGEVPEPFNPTSGLRVRVTINFPDGHSVSDDRPVEVVGPDKTKVSQTKWNERHWNANVTAALGRALRQAGFPDKATEVAVVAKWIGKFNAPPPQAATAPVIPAAPVERVGRDPEVVRAEMEERKRAAIERGRAAREVPAGVDPETGEKVGPPVDMAQDATELDVLKSRISEAFAVLALGPDETPLPAAQAARWKNEVMRRAAKEGVPNAMVLRNREEALIVAAALVEVKAMRDQHEREKRRDERRRGRRVPRPRRAAVAGRSGHARLGGRMVPRLP